MEVNDYLKRMEDQESANQSRFAASLTLATGTNPEEIARKKRIASLLGTPLEAVEGDFDTAKQMATVKEVADNTADAPATRLKYTDADFAKLAQDQSAQLGVIERMARNLAAGFGGDFVGSGMAGMGHTLGSIDRLLNDQPWYDMYTGEEMGNIYRDRLAAGGTPWGASLTGIGKEVKDYGQSAAPQGEQTFADQVLRGVGQMFGPLALMSNPFTAPVGLAMMYGQGADQMVEKIAKDKAAQAADQTAKDWEVLSGGAISLATEWLTSKILLGKLEPKAISAIKNRLLYWAANIAYGTASENVQETSENIGHDLSHIIATNPEAKVAWAEAMQAGGVGAVVGGLTAAVIQSALHIRGRRFQQALTELSDASKAQALRERDPATYQGYADSLAGHLASTTDGAVENLYIDAQVFNQVMTAAQVDPAEAAKAMGIDAQTFEEAKVTGGDVVIPINQFIGKVAGTELGDALTEHVRSAPDALSMAETVQVSELAGDIQTKADEIMSKQEERKARQQSMNEVRQAVFEQLQGAGTYTPVVNRAYALFMSNWYATMAEKMNITPAELYQRMPYKVTSGELGGQQGGMMQGADNINTPEFAEWFGDSKVVDAEGKPLVVYHGTSADIEEFAKTRDLGFHAGTDEQANNARFVGEGGGRTGANVMPLYMSIQNPISMRDLNTWKPNFIIDELHRIARTGDYPQLTEAAVNAIDDARSAAFDQGTPAEYEAIRNGLKALGFDGVTYGNLGEGEQTERSYIAFSPTQIKSVYNRGTFDPNDANILRQEGSRNYNILNQSGRTAWVQAAQDTDETARKDLQKALAKFFGVTRNPREAGYILTDGTMLDMTGRHYAQDHPSLRNRRSVDHRELFGENNDGFSLDGLIPDDLDGSDAMAYIMATAGAMRIDVASGVASSIGIPSQKQIAALGNALKGEYLALSYINPETGKIVDEVEIDSTTPLAIKRFYEQAKSKPDSGSYFQSSAGSRRAGFDPASLTTILTQQSDYSSFLHESAHFFLTAYAQLAADPNASPRLREDMDTLLNWFGVGSLDEWNGMTLEQQRKFHEQFAYNFEVYLFEGKAPNPKMQGVFERFSSWLKKVYKSIRDELNTIYRQEHGTDLPLLTGEVRQVMDRMLASDEQIAQAEAIRGMMPIYTTQEASGMSDEEWAAYKAMQDEAHEQALAEHTTASLRQMKWLGNAKSQVLAALQAEAREIRRAIRAEVTREVERQPIYRAIRFFKKGEAVTPDGVVAKEAGPHKLSLQALEQMYPEDKPVKPKKIKPPKFRSLLGEIREAGGIRYTSLASTLDVNELKGGKGGNRFLAVTGRKGRGWGMDQMANMMADRGWQVPLDIDGNPDADAFAQMVRAAVAGEVQLHPDDAAMAAEMEYQKAADEALASEDAYLASLVEYFDQMQLTDYPDYRALGTGKYGMLSTDGIHPDLVAPLFGFTSGDQLVRALLETAPMNTTINSLTDQRMLEEHGELTDPQAMGAAVDNAVHNEARARFIAVELRHLARSQRPARVMQEAARQVARRMLGKKIVKDIRPHEYAAAEARAAKAAEAAMKAGDTALATQQKEYQLLQNALAVEAVKAKTEMQKTAKDFQKVFASDKRLSKGRDMNYVNAARAILSLYGLGQTEQGADFYLAKIKQYDPEFYAEIEEMITAHQASPRPLNQLSLDEFNDLADQIGALWHLSRRTKQMEIDGELIDRRQVVGELNDRTRELVKPGNRPGYAKAMTKWEKTKIRLMGARAALRRVEAWVDAMDGGNPNGVFRRYIWTPISEAVTEFRVAKKDYLARYVEMLKDAEPLLKGPDINATELGYTFKRQELLHALLHTGNSSNKRKLLLGRGWATLLEDGQTLDSRQWDAFVARAQAEGILTKEHYDFAQKVWDLMESMKPGAQKAHMQMYGFYFSEITAEPIQTPFGTYAGGYVPAVTDPNIVREGAMRNEQETQMGDNSFMFPTTGRGFTKGRVEYNKPLLLDLGFLAGHMDKVLRFTFIEPRIKDVARIVKTDTAFAEQMDQLDPTIRGDMLVPWLQRTAMQMVSIPSKGEGGKLADSVFKYLRTNTGMQLMVANVTNTLQQFTGLFISALKVKPAKLGAALVQYIRQPGDTVTMIVEKSPFMATRMTAGQYELTRMMDELLLNPNKYDKLVSFAQKHGYFMQTATQGIVDTITWMGAYNLAVEQGVSEKEAVRQADAAVRMTLGSFAPEDVSRFETGSAFMRAFTHFYSYFNMQANILGTEFASTVRNLGVRKGAGRLLYIYAFGFMAPAVISEMIVQAMGGFDAGDDDEYDVLDGLGLFLAAQGRTLAAMVPGLGPAVIAGFNAFNSKPYDDRMSTSPAVSTIEAVVSTPHSVYKAVAEDGSWKKASRDVLTTLGMITRLPLGQLGKPVGYLADVAQGKTEPEGAMDMARGLISGKDVNRKQ